MMPADETPSASGVLLGREDFCATSDTGISRSKRSRFSKSMEMVFGL